MPTRFSHKHVAAPLYEFQRIKGQGLWRYYLEVYRAYRQELMGQDSPSLKHDLRAVMRHLRQIWTCQETPGRLLAAIHAMRYSLWVFQNYRREANLQITQAPDDYFKLPSDTQIENHSCTLKTYLLFVTLFLLPPLLLSKTKTYRNLTLISAAIPVVFRTFAAYPARNIRNTQPPKGRPASWQNLVFDLAQHLMHWYDHPTNLLPSLHVFNTTFAALLVGEAYPELAPWLMHWAVSIACSTQTTKQHVLADVISAWLVASLLFRYGQSHVMSTQTLQPLWPDIWLGRSWKVILQSEDLREPVQLLQGQFTDILGPYLDDPSRVDCLEACRPHLHPLILNELARLEHFNAGNAEYEKVARLLLELLGANQPVGLNQPLS